MIHTKPIIILFITFISFQLLGQKKIMDPSVYDIWNRISNVEISNNGDWVSYELGPEEGDVTLVLYNTRTQNQIHIERAEDASFDPNANFLAFKLKTSQDSIRTLKLKKTKKDKMPKDSLGIMNLATQHITKVPKVKSFRIPEEGASLIAYKMSDRDIKKDTTLIKKENSENGSMLCVMDFSNDTTYHYDYVKDYLWSKKNNQLLIHSSGQDSINNNTIAILDGDSMQDQTIWQEKGEYSRFRFAESGKKLAFIANRDTSDNEVKPYEIIYWANGMDNAELLCDQDSDFVNEGWQLSPHYSPLFTEDEDRLFFGVAPIPFMEDTTKLNDEKPVVEVWNYKDGLLYTQQNDRLKREKERSYEVCYNIKSGHFTSLASREIPETMVSSKTKGPYVVSYTELPYQQMISWLGYAHKDVYLTNLDSGEKTKIATDLSGTPRLSPNENYLMWHDRIDTSWVTYDIESTKTEALTKGSHFYELHDQPSLPWPSGVVGWTEDDNHVLIYDHYDIWRFDPTGKSDPQNLTRGRKGKLRYRYVRMDRDIDAFPGDTTLLLKVFDEKDKSSGYVYLNLESGHIRPLTKGPFSYTTRIYKAKHSDDIVFTKSSFGEFPDLLLSKTDFKNPIKISNANPQQSEYEWGSIELVKWQNSKGEEVEGLLVKPDNFDPNKKYPMIVNFYERSSDGLHRHRDPYPHRSTINYSYYANRGYVIFNPDVKYEVGYPGKSCEEAVISGTKAMIEKGFIDENNIGLQGHSWGGYQIAHLVTKTDMFKCAEAGAPVVNMISAYGGIRWGSGMSRMFQYEKTQSRLGATLWERPDLYLENSPIFNIDKVNTPVLILHNDQDGAVPWYQGIEYFVALRRLGKPAWMLNYNEEPHWPLKRPNRLDFNKRLEQFFDHYLMGDPMPRWMESGVPAVEKGYKDGLEVKEARP